MAIKEFKNEPVLNFTLPANIKKQKDALQAVRKKLGKKYEIIIGGKKIKTAKLLHSYNPSNQDEVIASFYKGDIATVEKAVETAAKTFETWKYVPAAKRAAILFKAAAIARRRHFEINAYMILEAGKNFAEADADTAEAIDFLEFYGTRDASLCRKTAYYPLPRRKE